MEFNKEDFIKWFSQPSNWAVLIGTYYLWDLVGHSYSTLNNFDITIAKFKRLGFFN